MTDKERLEFAGWAMSYISWCAYVKTPCSITYLNVEDILFGIEQFTEKQLVDVSCYRDSCLERVRGVQ